MARAGDQTAVEVLRVIPGVLGEVHVVWQRKALYLDAEIRSAVVLLVPFVPPCYDRAGKDPAMPIADDVPLHDVTDRAIRQSLQQADNLRDFLHQAVPDLAETMQTDMARRKEIQQMRQSLGEALVKEGRVEALQKTVLRQGRRRFSEPGEQIIASVTAIKDMDRLERLTDRLLDVNSWQELLETA